jgi:hypothetical protein
MTRDEILSNPGYLSGCMMKHMWRGELDVAKRRLLHRHSHLLASANRLTRRRLVPLYGVAEKRLDYCRLLGTRFFWTHH